MVQTTTVVIKELDNQYRRGKKKKSLKIQHFLLTGEAPYVKKMEKKGRRNDAKTSFR